MENKDTNEFCLRVQTKKHRAMESLTFLGKCNQLNILPNYTRISKSHIKATKLSPSKVIELRKRKVNESIKLHAERLERNNHKLENVFKTLSKNTPTRLLSKIKSHITYKVKSNEIKRDKRRNAILKFKKTDNNIAQIVIYNETNVVIPYYIQNILKFGLSHPVGGKSKALMTLTSLDSFYNHWSSYARTVGIKELDILKFRAALYLEFTNLTQSFNNNKDRKSLNDSTI